MFAISGSSVGPIGAEIVLQICSQTSVMLPMDHKIQYFLQFLQ